MYGNLVIAVFNLQSLCPRHLYHFVTEPPGRNDEDLVFDGRVHGVRLSRIIDVFGRKCATFKW